MEQINFINDLIARFPRFRLMLDEHLSDYDALLPHVFLSTVAQNMTRSTHSEQPVVGEDIPVVDLLDFVEQRFESGSEELDELISVSFVELFSPYVAEDAAIVRMLPPKLANECARIYLKRT